MACPHPDVRCPALGRRGAKLGGKAEAAARSIRAAAGEGNDRTGDVLEPSLMPRKAEPRVMGCWSGVEGLAVEERQAPAGESVQTGASTVVLGV
jgi:hypothetical protein